MKEANYCWSGLIERANSARNMAYLPPTWHTHITHTRSVTGKRTRGYKRGSKTGRGGVFRDPGAKPRIALYKYYKN